MGQMLANPKVMGVAAGIIFLLGVIPGMPAIVFLPVASLLGYSAWRNHQNQEAARLAPKPVDKPVAAANPGGEATWEDLQPVDTLGLEVGYRLIQLVDKDRGGDLLNRIKGVRRKFAQEVGFLPPSVHIKDNLELRPSHYRITLRGAVVGEGEVFPNMLMAINPGHVTNPIQGAAATDPAFGLPAVWVEERQRDAAQMAGYTVVDPSTVVATHLSHLMQLHAAKLLGRVETQQLVEHVTKLAPKLIEDVVPKMVGIPILQKVLQLLLEEGVHIRDMRSIIETLAETDLGRWSGGARSGRAGPPHSHWPGPRHRPADLWPGEGAGCHRHRARPRTPADPGPDLANGPMLDPGVADHLTRQAADAIAAPGKPGSSGLPAGARRHPPLGGASAQACGPASEGVGPQRDS
jgi:flagellar biosynthesis protein FlhA